MYECIVVLSTSMNIRKFIEQCEFATTFQVPEKIVQTSANIMYLRSYKKERVLSQRQIYTKELSMLDYRNVSELRIPVDVYNYVQSIRTKMKDPHDDIHAERSEYFGF